MIASVAVNLLSQLAFQHISVPHPRLNQLCTIGKVAAIGSVYGYLAKTHHPNETIYPSHYGVWFVIKFGIAKSIYYIEGVTTHLLGEKTVLDKNQKSLTTFEHLRARIWKVILKFDSWIDKIDQCVSSCLGIQPRKKINKHTLKDSCYLEICRYRLWPTVKATLLSAASFSTAHYLTKHVIGLTLPSRHIPVILLVQSVVFNIILTPFIYQSFVEIKKELQDIPDEEFEGLIPKEKMLAMIETTLINLDK